MAGCWGARIAGLLIALFFVAFVIGEGPPPPSVDAIAWGAMISGYLLAWKWQGIGGAMALAGLAVLWFLNRHMVGDLFGALAVVAVVHILCWFALGRRGRQPSPLPHAIWIALGVFILLCANEIFGNPPLMTPRHPSADIVGSWHSADAALTVAPGGALSGTVEGYTLAGARVIANRTWFGRLMHWRTDYTVHGNVNGFLWLAGTHLRGDLMMADGRKQRFEVVR